MAHRCPTCGKTYDGARTASEEWKAFPFCCDRCQMVDLNKWFREEYRISEPATSAQQHQGRGPQAPLDEEEA